MGKRLANFHFNKGAYQRQGLAVRAARNSNEMSVLAITTMLTSWQESAGTTRPKNKFLYQHRGRSVVHAGEELESVLSTTTTTMTTTTMAFGLLGCPLSAVRQKKVFRAPMQSVIQIPNSEHFFAETCCDKNVWSWHSSLKPFAFGVFISAAWILYDPCGLSISNPRTIQNKPPNTFLSMQSKQPAVFDKLYSKESAGEKWFQLSGDQCKNLRQQHPRVSEQPPDLSWQ